METQNYNEEIYQNSITWKEFGFLLYSSAPREYSVDRLLDWRNEIAQKSLIAPIDRRVYLEYETEATDALISKLLAKADSPLCQQKQKSSI